MIIDLSAGGMPNHQAEYFGVQNGFFILSGEGGVTVYTPSRTFTARKKAVRFIARKKAVRFTAREQ